MRTSAFQAVRLLLSVAFVATTLLASTPAVAAEAAPAGVKTAVTSKTTDAPPVPEEKEVAPPSRANAAPPEEVAKLQAQKRELDELGTMVKDFQTEAKEFRRDASDLIQRKLDEKKQELSKFYDKQIKTVEAGERQARIDAIAVFERFVQLYPDDPKYTPDSMTRLAELYYEKTVDDQQIVMADYEERVRLGSDESPPEQQRSFEKSIALYQEIITRFPDYRLADSIHYLLGWCLGEQGEPEQARDAFKNLTEKFPKSKYVPEAWVRIGEYYFDYQPPAGMGVSDINAKLQEAVNAYKNALSFKDSPFYDKALYKLGWAYYRTDDFDNAVDTFVRLVDYYDEMKKAGKDTGGDLRQEALQYTAISFSDDKWGPTHSLSDFFASRGSRPWEYELFKKLGDIQFDKTQYREAIANYQEVIRRNPMAADAPATQERIIQSYARLQDRENAFKERTVLAETYGDKSTWAITNKENQEALDSARELIEKALLLTAQYYHEQAEEFAKKAADEAQPQDIRDQLRGNAIKAYKDAAGAYANYLKQFPRSKNAYDISYLYAETLYNSLQFNLAADAFATVRDSNADNKYLVNASYYVVLSLQREIESEERQGLLTPLKPCTVTDCKDKELKPLEIPAIRLKLVEAADIYLQKTPTAEDAPILSYKAGQTYFTYFHFDEALERYDDVIERFPDKDVAVYAYEDKLIQAMLVKDWVKTEEIATKMLDLKQIQSDPKKFEDKRLVKYGARFEIANQLMAKKDWDGAAKKYLSVVTDTEAEAEQHGRWPNSDKALFNAAACFKAEYKFDSAMRTYEKLYTDYPKSELAEQSLFFVAENAEKSFEFDKAIDRYRQLVRDFKNSKDRQAAQFNAARRLEALQRYKEAAEEYKKYATLFPAESDAPDMMYQAAVMYQRMKDTPGLINNLQTYILKNANKPEQFERIVQARLKIANAYVELKKDTEAKKAFKQVVDDYDRFKMTPDNYNAAQAASEAAFAIAEDNFESFQNAKFDPKGRGNNLAKSMKDQLTSLATKLEDVKKEYTTIIVKYRWPEWMTAALFRIGYADDLFAQKILATPCPKELKNMGEDACEALSIQLSEFMAPVLERAGNAYQVAADKARDLRVVNKWTKLAMEKVCENTPANCRSMKDPREQLISESLSPLPLTADVNGSRAVVYEAPPAPKPPAAVVEVPKDEKAAAIGAPPVPKKDEKGGTVPATDKGGAKDQPVLVPMPGSPAPAAGTTTTAVTPAAGTTTTAVAPAAGTTTTTVAPAKPAAKPATTTPAPADAAAAPVPATKAEAKTGGAP